MDYYEANRSALKLVMSKSSSARRDLGSGCVRPSNDIILLVIIMLEPRLPELLDYWFLVGASFETIISTLGLNFDPEKELEKRAEERAAIQQAEIVPSLPEAEFASLDDIRQQIKQQENNQ